MLRSDLICRQCGHTSTAFDPCVDVSLDLAFSSSTTASVPGGAAADGAAVTTLTDCLHRFTRPERLSQPVRCQRCASYQPCTKQMSVRDVTLTLSLTIAIPNPSPNLSPNPNPIPRRLTAHLHTCTWR